MIDFENLSRWLYASCSKYISGRADGIITFFEGADRPKNAKTFAEFRMDGPRLTLLSRNYWQIWVAINVLVQNTMDDDGFHGKHVAIGKIVDAMNTPIPVYKFGDGISDDSTVLVGCLEMIHDKFNRLQVNHFGQIDKTVRLEQATVEAHYLMYLEG